MVDWDAGDTLAERMRSHAGTAGDLYGEAMRGMADDWDAGGPVRTVCAGYESAPPGSVIQLRLLAAVFRLVLTGRAEELRPFYPCFGGVAPPADSWPLIRDAIARHQGELHDALAIPSVEAATWIRSTYRRLRGSDSSPVSFGRSMCTDTRAWPRVYGLRDGTR